MRMTKALIAAVSLALVLVAAVVVPLVVMPGLFGFNDWPEATPSAAHEQVVKLDAPAKRTVAVERKRPAPATPKPVASPRQRPAQVPPPQPAQPLQPAAPATPPVPAAPTAPAEPQAAPEAQPEPVAIDARQNLAPVDGLLDGTN